MMWEIIQKGGILMWPILLCSILALAIIIERFWYFARLRRNVPFVLSELSEYIKTNRIKEAIDLCQKRSAPVFNILTAGLMHYDQSKAQIKEAMEETSLYEVPKLEKNLAPLATIAHISPLLGLLGTVYGLVKTFHTIEIMSDQFGPISPGALAGGIWEALLTTVAGLVVAIVAFIAYNYFVNKVNFLVTEMERSAAELTSLLTESSVVSQ